MVYQLLLLIMLINCAKGEEELSAFTLDLIMMAQCEAQCDNIGAESTRSEAQTNNSHQDEVKNKVFVRECLKNCFQEKLPSNFTVPTSLRQSSVLTAPELHCREATFLNIRWQSSEEAVFVLEMRDEENQVWEGKNKTKKMMYRFSKLKENSKYQFRLRAISSDGQLGNSVTSDWISTLTYTFKPQEVHNITIVDVTSNPTPDLLQIAISWIPAEDRTCFYEVVFWSDKMYPSIYQMSQPEEFEVVLNNLKFGTYYSVSIMGKSEDDTRESTKAWLNFTTQDCLVYYDNDLTKCVPPKPSNLTAEEEVVHSTNNVSILYNVNVSWATPDPLPSGYEVELVRMEPDASSLARENTTGNTTWISFSSVNVGYQYEVIVKAVSSAGYSDLASIVRKLADIPPNPTSVSKNRADTYGTVWNVSYLWLLAILPVLVISITVGICLYMHHQKGKRIRHERRCQYIEKYSVVVSNLARLVFSLLNYQTRERKPSLRTQYTGSVECDLDYNAEWEIPRENLLLGDVLGEGAFGIVRKGVLQEGDGWRDVAVKMLRDEPSTEDLRQFKQEINVMQSVGRHPHIVSLIGCCTRSGRLRLVVEYCAEGDLLNFLREHWNDLTQSSDEKTSRNSGRHSHPLKYAELMSQRSTSDAESINPLLGTVTNKMYDVISAGDDDSQSSRRQLLPADLLSFARQIAIGMEYLANNRVVHRDLAARNVLVCSDRTVKISDFGLSRDIYEENVYRKKGSGRLPVKWMALESLLHQIYTTQSDVWSFGVLLWEIVTLGGNPYPGIPTNKLFGLLKQGYRMECPSNCKKELYDIMLACWQAKPKDRPTFVDLHKMLDTLLETSSPHKYLNLNIINFKSDITPLDEETQHNRSSGGYLESSTCPQDAPALPFSRETDHQYLNTPVNEGIKN